jgi:hypothetical protein
MAGTGKTAIASTFARDMEQQGILGATFFIDRQEAERRDLRRIVQTLAYDLAKQNHGQLRAIWTVMCNDPTFDRWSYQKQVRFLIKEPMDLARPEMLVVLIDGLDECGAFHGASLLETLVRTLAHHPIKLFVTSRNEADIVNTLRDLPHTPIKLHEIGVAGDVRLYWEHNLDELRLRKRLPDWRSMVSLDLLVELTGHLFIYATTMLKIIRNTRTNPIKRLQELLEISRLGSGSTIAFGGPEKHGPLEKLYMHILREAVKDDDGYMSAEYAHQLHDILEVVIFAQAPITQQALSDLLHMDLDDLNAYLSPLRSVLVVPDATNPDDVIRLLHQSFPDFVRQQGGLVHPKLAIHSAVAEHRIVQWCLRQLNNLLRFDICDIQDASRFNREISDLETRMKSHISAALSYSCRYWVTHWLEHIRAAGLAPQVPKGLVDFCEEHLLHWVEVLSLTGNLDAVQRVMPDLVFVMNVRLSHSNSYHLPSVLTLGWC